MATLNIDNEIYDRLSQKAAERHTTVEQLVIPVLEHLVQFNVSSNQREKAFEQWMLLIKKRHDRLAENHRLDDSRESIYDGRGE